MLVVGGGPAGLECARVLALRGHVVELREATAHLGGAVVDAALGTGRARLTDLTDWLIGECERLGVVVKLDAPVTANDLAGYDGQVVLTTGSRPRELAFGAVDAREALRGELPEGAVLVHDPVGGPLGVSVAEKLAGEAKNLAAHIERFLAVKRDYESWQIEKVCIAPQVSQTWRGRESPAGIFSATGAPQALQKFIAGSMQIL